MALREDIQNLQDRVRNAIKTLAELKKTPQAMSGDSWVFYRRVLTSGYDVEAHGITSTTFKKLYKLTYNVDHPETGFAQFFLDIVFDTPAQNMSYNSSPVPGDPYSIYIQIKHVNYTTDVGGINVRANIFATQKGTVSVVEI